MGPHEEGDDVTLTCRTVGGHPQPSVRWLLNGLVVDDQYEHNAGDVIENRLVWPSVSRKDLDAIFTCQAVNTKLTEPKEAMVVLDLHRKHRRLAKNDTRDELFVCSAPVDGENPEHGKSPGRGQEIRGRLRICRITAAGHNHLVQRQATAQKN